MRSAVRLLTYFSRSPLNYETLSYRISKYSKLSPDDLVDCIRACRTLQQSHRELALPASNSSFLRLKLIDSRRGLEDILFRFLMDNPLLASDQSVMSAYLLTEPRPQDVSQIYLLCVSAFTSNVGDELAASRILRCSLSRLLSLEDYQNAIKLVDSTFGAAPYLDHRQNTLKRIMAAFWSWPITFTVVSAAALDGYMLMSATIINFTIAMATGWAFSRANTLDSLSRVSWRPYVSLWDKWKHQNELVYLNRIVTHFEELHEINIRNFHNLKIRQHFSNMQLIEREDYILELPDTSKDVLDHVLVLLRNQVQKRKMVLNDPEEELMVLEYWLTHGEKFTWDEPDQDPAEIISLKFKHQVKDPLGLTEPKSHDSELP